MPTLVLAQGTLSTQGLGYPPGQLSTVAATMGGSIGDADARSPLNPAAIGLLTSPLVLFQVEPEYRQVRIGTRSERTSVARFPLFMGSMPLGPRWGVSASASTLLDRTWETTTRDSQVVSGDTVRASLAQLSDGSITDVRIALSYGTTSWLKIGIAGHGFSGRDVVRTIRAFDDTARFAQDTLQTTLSFGGNAVSVGAVGLWPRIGAIGISYRLGGGLSAYSGNQTVGSGSAPDHFGISFLYLGVRGTTVAVRAARDSWSKLEGLAKTLNIHEGWDMGIGADVTGPAILGGSPIGLRAGARSRTLPFSANATAVREQTLSGGFAFPMAAGRVELSLGALHATRTGTGASENAWTISTGFAVRP